MAARARSGATGVTLIELLVVLFIMGIMMGMLLPTLGRVRARADVTVCENNVRQLQIALAQFIQTRRTFPRPNEWTVDLLPWIEQQPLFDQMRNRSPTASFPRPPLMLCPLQNEPSTWIAGSSTCHYMLVVDRQQLNKDNAHYA
jgi:prepilin-type N-terminal cleavage/methylation domain-containing protein